jgi:mono/diheme cytochrome c family protein
MKLLATAFAVILLATTIALDAGSRSVAAAAPDGKTLFNTNCSTCHQENGQGQPNVFPPLAGNTEVTAKDPTQIIGYVLHGISSPKAVMGKPYAGGMPPWKGTLSNAEIAAILTYVRSAWGNKGTPVTEKQVAAVK